MGSLPAVPRILLALVGAVVSGYALVGAGSLASYYWRAQGVATTWCSQSRACASVEMDGNIFHPQLRVHFKEGRALMRERLESELAAAGLRRLDKDPAFPPKDIEITVQEESS